MSTADGEFTAMMYDCVEYREKGDERIQIVVKKLFGCREHRVKRAKWTGVYTKLVENAEKINKVQNVKMGDFRIGVATPLWAENLFRLSQPPRGQRPLTPSNIALEKISPLLLNADIDALPVQQAELRAAWNEIRSWLKLR